MTTDPYADFRQAVDAPDDDAIDLGRAALTIALGDYPDLDVSRYLSEMDRLASEVIALAGSEPAVYGGDVYRSIAALNHVLFGIYGYRGNREDYYDPRNSFLNHVIDLKRGIPITLSVLYMEVARRVGLTLKGVGFPGHFLVKYSSKKEEIVIDPFNLGAIRSRESLQNLLRELYGGKVVFHRSFLHGATKEQILQRMLNNLKATYLRSDDIAKALPVLDRLLILAPDSMVDLRDRGLIYVKLECFKLALDDLENYLRVAPDAEDVTTIRRRVIDLRKQVAQIQ